MSPLNEATLQRAQNYFKSYVSVKWQGACTPGKLINGHGVLVQVTDLRQTTNQPGQGTDWYECDMVNGVQHGTCSHRDSYPENSSDYGSYEMTNGCFVRDTVCNASPAPPPPPELTGD
jgi:hypothetical protein